MKEQLTDTPYNEVNFEGEIFKVYFAHEKFHVLIMNLSHEIVLLCFWGITRKVSKDKWCTFTVYFVTGLAWPDHFIHFS